MSEEQLSALLAKLKEDASFRKKLQQASCSEDFVLIAREEGFELSIDEAVIAPTELSDFDLESIAGGKTGTQEPGFCRTNVASWQDIDAGKRCGGGC